MDQPTCSARPCDLDVVTVEVVPLCDQHLELMTLWMVPKVYAAYPSSRWYQAADRYAKEFGPIPMSEPAGRSTARLPHITEANSVVYFVRTGDRVKIGTTMRLKQRISALSLADAGEVVLTLKGGRPLEQKLHRQFRAQRIGHSEWFHLDEKLAEYIKAAG